MFHNISAPLKILKRINKDHNYSHYSSLTPEKFQEHLFYCWII